MTTILRWATPAPRYDVTIETLIVAGVLAVGTILTTTRKGVTLYAVVGHGGLYVNRQWYAHPSTPIEKHARISSNGWNDWKLPDGRTTLGDLREQYRREG